MDKHSSKQSIAHNSVALTFRMILRMVVSLYTTRIILNALGIDDFGVYNVIAGFSLMFSFVNTSMSTAISRFLSYSIGKGEDISCIRRIFSVSFTTQIIIMICVLVLAELIGVPLINYYIEIPEDRIFAANILYQCTLVSLAVNILQVPYNATIIAFERMTAYAYIEILYVTLLLCIAFFLQIMSGELLIYYGIMLSLVNIILFFTYKIYVSRFGVCSTAININWGEMKPILKFSGADFYANCSLSVQTQGQNLIINKFLGLVANASAGVSNQIYGALLMFSSSITTAIRPRIIKYYAARQQQNFTKLVNDGSQLVSFANICICVPLIFILPVFFSFWLKEIPVYAVIFGRILLINNCLYGYKTILIACIHASGEITRFSLLSGSLFLLSIPLQYIIAYTGADAAIVYGLIIFITGLNICLIVKFACSLTGLNIKKIFKRIVIPPIYTVLLIVIIGFMIKPYIPSTLTSDLIFSIIIFILTITISSFTVLNNSSRALIFNYLNKLVNKNIRKDD